MKTCFVLFALVAGACASLNRLTRGNVNITEPLTVIRQREACHVDKNARIPCSNSQNNTRAACESANCCWDPVERRYGYPQCFETGVVTTYFDYDYYTSSVNGSDTDLLCSSQDYKTPYLADFTKDGSADVFCKYINQNATGNTTITYYKVGEGYDYDDPDNALFEGGFCTSRGDTFKVVDVNGDRMADLVCVRDNGDVQIKSSYFTSDGVLPTELKTGGTVTGGVCSTDKSQIYVGDFNGDGRADLLCLCKATPCAGARRHLSKGDNGGSFKVPLNDPNFDDFCSSSDDKLHVADFDKDDRDDLICEKPNGEYQIALTDGDGLLVNQDWSESHGWCGAAGDEFFVGYFNNDGRADLMCHLANKSICIRYNSHIYKWEDMFEEQSCTPRTWCENGTLKIADFNGDGYDDLYCFDNKGKFRVSISKRPTALVRFTSIDFPNGIGSDIDKFYGLGLKTFCDRRSMHLGDVNGDKKQDYVCHDKDSGSTELVYGDQYGQPNHGSLKVFATWNFCYRNNYYPEYPTLITMDVNGDGLSDLLCHFPDTGYIFYTPASATDPAFRVSMYGRQNQQFVTFCQGHGVTVIAGDLDGDSKDDLICLNRVDGELSFVRSGGFNFANTIQVYQSPNCSGADKDIFVGKFNDDDRQDIMCQDRITGYTTFLISSGAFGEFEAQSYDIDDPFCGNIAQSGANVHVGDYNGDGLWDIACHYQSTKITLRYNKGFDTGELVFGDEWTWQPPGSRFCVIPGRYMMSYDANGDDLWDLTCRYVSHGYIFIVEGHIVAGENFVVTKVKNETITE